MTLEVLMSEREQSYKTHTRLLPPFHFFVLPVMLINFVNAVRHAIQDRKSTRLNSSH